MVCVCSRYNSLAVVFFGRNILTSINRSLSLKFYSFQRSLVIFSLAKYNPSVMHYIILCISVLNIHFVHFSQDTNTSRFSKFYNLECYYYNSRSLYLERWVSKDCRHQCGALSSEGKRVGLLPRLLLFYLFRSFCKSNF